MSANRNPPGSGLGVFFACMVGIFLIVFLPDGYETSSGSPDACSHYTATEQAVCQNYTNGAQWVRQNYYADSDRHGQNDTMLAKRFTGSAYNQLVMQTAGWPDDVTVTPPTTRIDSVTISPDGQSATLTSTETWNVTGPNGGTLYKVNSEPYQARLLLAAPDIWTVDSLNPSLIG